MPKTTSRWRTLRESGGVSKRQAKTAAYPSRGRRRRRPHGRQT